MFAEPLVEVRCAVCGSANHEIICPAEVIDAHLQYLRRFHRRRLRTDAPPEAVADRAHFTQDYATKSVACRRCGLLFRDPRPTDAAVACAYGGDHYGRERLKGLFDCVGPSHLS